jgi:TrmH family RNA methyltransferase
MVSVATLKWIHALSQKKQRDEQALFVAEGYKTIGELLPFFQCKIVLTTEEQWQLHPLKLNIQTQLIKASLSAVERASVQITPQGMVAVFEKPRQDEKFLPLSSGLYLALDGVQNPGNLGTIIRLADWFGIRQIFCSYDSADVYNPKTVQATMGSLGRVRVLYTDLVELITTNKDHLPVFGTFLEGDSLFSMDLPKDALIVLGSEGNGISLRVKACIQHSLMIPSFPIGALTTESLNVATAAAIVCAEFRRTAF